MSRYGRIFNPSRDRLFSDPPPGLCSISSGGVFLMRTFDDDYARFRLPDTVCPPIPGPDEPRDSGWTDEAEPGRWQYSGIYRQGTGWKFGRVQDDALNWVQPAYTCYDGDFTVELELSWSDAGLPRQSNAISADFDLFIFGIPSPGCGIALGSFGGESGYQPWQVAVCLYSGGNVGTQIGWLRAGVTGHFRISRAGSTISVYYVEGSNGGTVATNVTGQVQLRLWRDFTLPPPPSHHIPAVFTYSITTISGAPSSVTVTTPVVDFTTPVRTQITRLPHVGTLEWRASNTVFNRDDALPAWSNPSGEYRYWQARVTWTLPQYLLERIEVLGYNVRIAPVEWAGFGWLLHHGGVVPPYRPVEKPLGGVPRSVQIDGDSVSWYDADDEYITTRDK